MQFCFSYAKLLFNKTYTYCFHVKELNMILDSLSWAVMSDNLIDIVIANSLATHSTVQYTAAKPILNSPAPTRSQGATLCW